MSEDVLWEDFDKLHVIRKLRQIVAKWWDVQINFTDAKGYVRGVPKGRFFNPTNPICKAITKEQKGFSGCIQTVRKTTAASTRDEKAQLGRCHAGFSTLAVPIVVDNRYLGCVFGDGFIVAETAGEQKAVLRAYLKGNFATDADLSSYIEKLPILSSRDVEYLTQLIEMLVDEILLTQVNLTSAKMEVLELKSELKNRYQFANMVGKSPLMQELYNLLERVCDSNSLVLIQGENGTGKELIAKALHYNSKRASKKFVVVNCAAFNENLLESELFGHVKGAFTGAIKDKVGLFEAAINGTLFLDEIGDMSLNMQVKLLRVLQEGTFIPVGATEQKSSNARLVCATNKNLTKMVEDGLFREDLFYRLQVINVMVPALRDRKEDIPLLIEHFIQKNARINNLPAKSMSKECLHVFLNHDWPGNIRELENEIERLWVLAGSDVELSAANLSKRILESSPGEASIPAHFGKLKEATEHLEKAMIKEGLVRLKGNKSKLAKDLGISRAGLLMKVEKFGLEKK